MCSYYIENNFKVSKKEIFDFFDSLTPKQLASHGQLKWNLHPDCIGAWIAETDFGTSPVVADALHNAIDKNLLGYMPVGLDYEVKQACASFQNKKFGWNIKPENVYLIPDVLTCLQIMLDNFIPANTPVIVLTPAYMPFLTLPIEHDHPVIEVPAYLDENNVYRIDMNKLEDAFIQGAKLLILCNPWNPIGRVLSRAELEKISLLVDKYNGLVFNDEIHSPLVINKECQHINYPTVNPIAASHSITATSASKGWNIAGLKSAQTIITDDKLSDKFSQFVNHYVKTMPPIGMIAVINAYNDNSGWIEVLKEYLFENVRIVDEFLKDVPELDFSKPQGTYLGWIKISNAIEIQSRKIKYDGKEIDFTDCENIASVLRKAIKLAIVPGITCGKGFDNFIRINLAMPRPILEKCLSNLVNFVKSF